MDFVIAWDKKYKSLKPRDMASKKPADINEYLASFPESTQKVLEAVRQTIHKAAPKAVETISYAIPAFNLNDTYLVYFAGYKNHFSIYPAPTSEAAFKKDFAKYKTSKGTVQFPLDKPIPHSLITRIVKFLIKKNAARVAGKK